MTGKHYTIIDLETTGGDPRKDRITEIAAYRFDGEKVVDQLETLINPGIPIPPFITRITGINNEMVKDAPKFYEVAKRLVEITQDAVFVAHNVRFDYSFIQREYRNLGYTYSRKKLCTIQLSKKLLPHAPSYGLTKLCDYVGITNESRHRASGDAKATLELFRRLLYSEGTQPIQSALSEEIAISNLPPNLPANKLDQLPEEVGVYYFHDISGRILYVGKSRNIRKRVLSHFQGAYKATRTREMIQLICDISFELTGSEIMALLLENEEIKKLQPPYNRAQKRDTFRYGVFIEEDASGFFQLRLDKLKTNKEPVARFSSKRHGQNTIQRQARNFKLCPKFCGIEHISGRCFYQQLDQCKGACEGTETSEVYNQRVEQAIFAMNFGSSKEESFLVISEGRNYQEQSVVWVEKGHCKGYAYLDIDLVRGDMGAVCEAIPLKPESPDVLRIIKGYARKHPKEIKKLL